MFVDAVCGKTECRDMRLPACHLENNRGLKEKNGKVRVKLAQGTEQTVYADALGFIPTYLMLNSVLVYKHQQLCLQFKIFCICICIA